MGSALFLLGIIALAAHCPDYDYRKFDRQLEKERQMLQEGYSLPQEVDEEDQNDALLFSRLIRLRPTHLFA